MGMGSPERDARQEDAQVANLCYGETGTQAENLCY